MLIALEVIAATILIAGVFIIIVFYIDFSD